MATAALSLQLGVRRCCAAARPAASRTMATRATASVMAMMATRGGPLVAGAGVRIRGLSGTAGRAAKDDDEDGEGAGGKELLEDWELEMQARELEAEKISTMRDAMRETLPAEVRETVARATTRLQKESEERALNSIREPIRLERSRDVLRTFWNEDEVDPEMVAKETAEDEEEEEHDITSVGHSKLDEIRERRHYARIAAWEMPLLANFAKAFEPPTRDQPLRFRYTSYMGEFHPAERKVVVEFCPADLDLTPVQQNKLKKLAGPRFNPETEIVRMSCEAYEHQAQNKRYLGDLVARLIAEAKDPTDTFEDIPLDTRHHKIRVKPKFPKAWRMTEARRQELEAFRAEAFLRDQQRAAAGTLVDGTQRVQASLAAPRPGAASDKVADKVAEMAQLRPAGGQTPLHR